MELLIRYETDVPARDGRRAFGKGETYAVADEAIAQAHHPDATIIGHVDGTPYEPKRAAARAATEKAPGA